MTSALTLKELRENAWIAALGLVALLLVALSPMGLSPLPGLLQPARGGQIPFLSDAFVAQLFLFSGVVAIGLGFRQSLGDFFGESHLFLLHRPVSRRRVYATKLAVGLAIYLVVAGISILLYAVWAAWPGTHASPFAWSMTLPAWTSLLAASALYLGAFLSGIRPAAWLGTRLMPLAAACGFAALAFTLPQVAIAWPLLIAFDALLVMLVLHVAQTRDFA